MQVPSMEQLLEAGVHFGHQVRRWNPKMKPYIFTAREGVHVIDLGQTVPKLEEAVEFVTKVGEAGGAIIFLGSKKQARSIVTEEAKKAGAMYIAERWIGGLLTNFEQTKNNLKKLKDLKEKREAGEFKERTKKEQLMIDRQINKLERFYGGVEDLIKPPDALFVIDVRREENACREAKKKGIPVVAICDTNADLFLVDYPIPGNDDAIKAITIVTETIASAYKEGREKYGKKSEKEKVELAGEPIAKSSTTKVDE
ncbi:30S ribosomal protein S2 [Candidatus Curtissbacteria bacterium RIFCSPLOWO2_02_FULL_40_11]|uniref:Small ribosomal subunit protein uS2 n=2 Tax=Candidatus Curtissiibacteriota TaxID=1752717 RepID=A0A1F5G9H3_9BACT|nr:MAG: 30S ribosomal protein S2 [Candidatus Curtissbacteria bacterium RIFCSPHIGHO2_02_FULL_40_16b]OGE00314.1 MAG: 30S ribosomal protein S2 [Candidatus Curtissbacteria bacterium RIFCSPLOWO2_02_FULL_40_11]OGE14295.1 MAG: 30S ribosomal protein S2 [Candidatus Curtissbacteria bacterium RIFCSPLOWO2_12_FULL_38_9]